MFPAAYQQFTAVRQMDTVDTETLWAFALRIYARTGVEQTSLRLQDRCGADIPVLLFALWMGSCGRALSRDDLERIVATVQKWQDTVVAPLRQARVALRQLDSLPLRLRPEAETLREDIKAIELLAEKRELEWLESFSTVGVLRDRETAAAHNVLTFLDFLGTDASRVGRSDVETLLLALHPESKDS